MAHQYQSRSFGTGSNNVPLGGGGGYGMMERPASLSARRHRIDVGSGVVQHMYSRLFYRPNDADCKLGGVIFQPNKSYARLLGLPLTLASRSHTSACTLFCHACVNKSRCPINVVRWTKDGRRLLTGSHLGEFTLWSANNGFLYEKLMTAHDSAVRTMTWSHSGEWMVSGDARGVVKYWNTSLMLSKEIKLHTSSVRGSAFAPSDAKFATCSDDLDIKVVDFATAKEEMVLKGHGWDVKAIAWHPQKRSSSRAQRTTTASCGRPARGKKYAQCLGTKIPSTQSAGIRTMGIGFTLRRATKRCEFTI